MKQARALKKKPPKSLTTSQLALITRLDSGEMTRQLDELTRQHGYGHMHHTDEFLQPPTWDPRCGDVHPAAKSSTCDTHVVTELSEVKTMFFVVTHEEFDSKKDMGLSRYVAWIINDDAQRYNHEYDRITTPRFFDNDGAEITTTPGSERWPSTVHYQYMTVPYSSWVTRSSTAEPMQETSTATSDRDRGDVYPAADVKCIPRSM
mgnify:CR=1 FL=1